MPKSKIEQIIVLRAAVGSLGERNHCAWWDSSFFTTTAPTFLNPVFPRTRMLSQIQGVTHAATNVHDERIGVGQRVFHLFRLPEDLEQSVHDALQQNVFRAKLEAVVSSRETAMAAILVGIESNAVAAPIQAGPVHKGAVASLKDEMVWPELGSVYYNAIQSEQQTFPYFSDLA